MSRERLLSRLIVLVAALGFTAPATAAEGEGNVKEAAWCTIRTPAAAQAGDKAEIEVTLKPGAITQDSTLNVDLHKFVGKKRVPGAGKARPVKIKAGDTSSQTFKMNIPKDANAVSFVVYVLPEGKTAWKEKTHVAEAGMKVEAAAPDAPAAEPAAPQAAHRGDAGCRWLRHVMWASSLQKQAWQ